ncbi:12646_t:CDS:2 [Entrophospora sp. SA101]|nr:7111_t:CDS:2 [Entrophospora sp. SA101]CAJ0892161.1 12646_t:CDS:2 [Entrophospora sp. SA101]
MQLKLVITLIVGVLFMSTLDAARLRKRDDICTNNVHHLPPTNGQQIETGSCSSTVQGEIPAASKMPSTIIVTPSNGATLPAKQNFDIEVVVGNVVTGSFSDPKKAYYTKPQAISDDGLIIGHLHVVVQELPLISGIPLNPTEFEFFKGLEDAGSSVGSGLVGLSTTVDGGLSAGAYRLCTLSGTETHQPWIMPVAKRGSQDDYLCL